MKKITLFFCAFFFAQFLSAQIVNIPDANLKNKLLNYYPRIDTNYDDEIQISEAEMVTALSISLPSSQAPTEMDLTGIEAFINLENFSVTDYHLQDIDFSLPNLVKLKLYDNDLQNINLSQFPLLESLNVYGNQLQEMDLSVNLHLKKLQVTDNSLLLLDVSQNVDLISLYLSCDNLGELDLGNKPNLESISLSENNLNELNFSQTPNLLSVQLYNTGNIENLDFSQSPLIHEMYLNNYLFGDVYVVNNSSLNSVNISNNPNIEVLAVSGASSSLIVDLTNKPVLKVLKITDSPISSLDFSDCDGLVFVILDGTSVADLDFSNNPELSRLVLFNNSQLSYINLKNGSNTNFDGETQYVTTEGLGNIFAPKVFLTENCSNLNSICVDDIDFAIENFTDVSEDVTYTENCQGGDLHSQFVGTARYDKEVQFYPNPTSGMLNLSMANGTGISNVEVYDITGKRLQVYKNTNTIHLDNFSVGIYLLKIKDSKGNKLTQKVIKK